jgi:hypothetical protein
MADRQLLRRSGSANGDSTSTFPTAGSPATAGPVNVRVSGGQRQRRLPWIALGVLLLVMSILGFALWSVAQASRTPAFVADTDIQAGDTITRDDLTLVNVGADAGLAMLGSGDEDLIVGRVARGPIPAGTPLSAALVVSASEAVPGGQAVVGAQLAPGEYPTPDIQSGDRVRVIRTASQIGVEAEPEVDLGTALVWSVEPLESSSQQELFISLTVDEEMAATVASSAAEDRLRLILVGSES